MTMAVAAATERNRVSMAHPVEGPKSAMHLDCDSHFSMVAVGGRSVFKVYSIRDEGDDGGAGFVESVNMRNVKGVNLNYSCNDVVWSPLDSSLLATAATNGAIVLWNLSKASRQRQFHIFNDHQRMVNKVSFHPTDPNILISGSQDGTMRLFDLRSLELSTKMHVSNESVRDVRWNPLMPWKIAAVSENGQVQLWDARRTEAAEVTWTAHRDHVFSCEWHPELKHTLATGGRDKMVKVWDVQPKVPTLKHEIMASDAIAKISWRPRRRYQIASISQTSDYGIQVWDTRRPYVPFATFMSNSSETPSSFLWRGEPHTLISAGKGYLCQHVFDDALRLFEKGNPAGMAFNVYGDLAFAFRDGASQDVIPKTASDGKAKLGTSPTPSVPHTTRTTVKTSTLTKQELFRANVSRLVEIRCQVSKDFLEENNGTDDQLHLLTDQRHMKYIAQNYLVTGKPFSELCDHNAEVAMTAGRGMLAETWNLIKNIFMTDSEFEEGFCGSEVGDHNDTGSRKTERGSLTNASDNDDSEVSTGKETDGSEDHSLEDSGVGAAVAVSPPAPSTSQAKVNGNVDAVDTSDPTRSRVTSVSSKTRPTMSQKSRKHSVINVTSRDRSGTMDSNKTGGTGVTRRRSKSGKSDQLSTRKPDGISSDDNNSDNDANNSDHDESHDTLTNIASGHMFADYSGDFYGDSENIYYSEADSMNSRTVPTRAEPNFNNLPSEAFEYRRDFNVTFNPDQRQQQQQQQQQQEHWISSNKNTSLNGNHDAQASTDEPAMLQTRVTVVNSAMNTLEIDTEYTKPDVLFNADEAFAETLHHYANNNDPQSAVALYLVAEQRIQNRKIVEEHLLENWFMNYIELLLRMRLYIQANQMICLSPTNALRTAFESSTFIKFSCGRCSKLVNVSGLRRCRTAKCNNVPNKCAVCQELVNGLFAWCQGCGHGGHMDHMGEWYQTNYLCPAGCGHLCEYQ